MHTAGSNRVVVRGMRVHTGPFSGAADIGPTGPLIFTRHRYNAVRHDDLTGRSFFWRAGRGVNGGGCMLGFSRGNVTAPRSFFSRTQICLSYCVALFWGQGFVVGCSGNSS